VPDALVVPPTFPLVGVKESEASTVNVAEAVFVPSEATIVSAPFGTAGIDTVHAKLPVAPELQAEAAAVPSSLNVMGWEAANPAPVAVVVPPTAPLVGLNEREASTVNVAEALCVASDATNG
jgi:hypothetical protein